MIPQETLFILGSGASKPYNYQTGRELRKYICKELPVDLAEIIKKDTEFYKKAQTNKRIRDFADTFKKSAIQSIDLWLAMNPKFSEIGKIAIATSILKCECQSRFCEDIDNYSEDWYMYLYNRMTEGFSSPDSYEKFKDNKVAFITFNYDRSLEHFLYTSLTNSFVQKNVEDLILLSLFKDTIPIPFSFIHVYGQIDEPPWRRGSLYGEEISWDKIKRLASNIEVIGERTDKQSEIISNVFAKAKRIFFLGFGYAPENMEALGLPGTINPDKEIYGTAKGFTKKEIDEVRRFLQKKFAKGSGDLIFKDPIIEDKGCYQLLREYL